MTFVKGCLYQSINTSKIYQYLGPAKNHPFQKFFPDQELGRWVAPRSGFRNRVIVVLPFSSFASFDYENFLEDIDT